MNVSIRASHALDKRGTHAFADLKQLGAEMADQPMVTFAIGLVSGLSNNIAGITLSSQDSAVLPWVMWRDLQSCTHAVAKHEEALAWWRGRLRLLVLLAPYVANTMDLSGFWVALMFSPLGRAVCSRGIHLAASCFSMLWDGCYQNCPLRVDATAPCAEKRLVHPACQCGTRPQLRPGCMHFVRGGGDIADLSQVRIRGKQVCVPWWVSRSLYSEVSLNESYSCRNPFTEPPRWQVFDTSSRGYCYKKCRVPEVVRRSFQNMDVGMIHLQRFWHQYKTHFESYALGDVGMSTSMQHIFCQMSACWWLIDVLEMPEPSEAHSRAFGLLYEELLPDLKRRPWPDNFAMFPNVQQWPEYTETMITMYKRWWKGVHAAGKEPEYLRKWKKVVAFQVMPVARESIMKPLFDRVFGQCAGIKAARTKIVTMIVGFLRGGCYKVDPGDLRWKSASIASLRSRKCKHKVVVQVGTHWTWDQLEVANSIMHNPRFARNYCFHVSRMFAHSRMFLNKEAACERWVGDLKYLYHPVQGTTTATLTQRLRARIAGVRGGQVDDAFIQKLASSFNPQQMRSTSAKSSRAVENFLVRSRKQASKEGFPLLSHAALAVPTSASSVKSAKRNAREHAGHVEVAEMEKNDLELVSKMARSSGGKVAAMPFYARNKKEWDSDLATRFGMLNRTDRAKQYAVENEKPLLPVPPELQDQVAEQTSSSSDSSSKSSSSRSSSSAAPPVLGSSLAALVSGLSDAGVSTGSAKTKTQWVSPDGRLLHIRVDIGTYHENKPEYTLLCKPYHSKYQRHVNFKQGDDAESAAQTNLQWCAKCAKSL